MLEPPPISSEEISHHLKAAYGLDSHRLAFLPIGADSNTAVYRVEGRDGAYFLKLRRGAFDEITVSVPLLLRSQGLENVIAPLPTRCGEFWANLDIFTSILYPFIEGRDGYEVVLSGKQWQEFGAALKLIHTTQVPPELEQRIPVEAYAPSWREMVQGFQALVDERAFSDPVAAELAAFMRANRAVIRRLVEHTGHLAHTLLAEPPELVLCHTDLHPGNLFISPEGALYIVDWDNPKMAPREHDLMHIGGSPTWNDQATADLFYQGYGSVQINRTALAYYRCERIILDIAAFGEQLLLSSEGGSDREQSLKYFKSNFLPGHEIEIAFKTK